MKGLDCVTISNLRTVIPTSPWEVAITNHGFVTFPGGNSSDLDVIVHVIVISLLNLRCLRLDLLKKVTIHTI